MVVQISVMLFSKNNQHTPYHFPENGGVVSCELPAITVPEQAQKGPHGSWRLRLPDFPDSRHMKVVKL